MKTNSPIQMTEAQLDDIYAAGFWSDFKQGFKKGFKGTADIIADSEIPIVKDIAKGIRGTCTVAGQIKDLVTSA